jgi:hypothetical protein
MPQLNKLIPTTNQGGTQSANSVVMCGVTEPLLKRAPIIEDKRFKLDLFLHLIPELIYLCQ